MTKLEQAGFSVKRFDPEPSGAPRAGGGTPTPLVSSLATLELGDSVRPTTPRGSFKQPRSLEVPPQPLTPPCLPETPTYLPRSQLNNPPGDQMTFTRTIFLALAVLLPTSWTVARAGDKDNTGETKTDTKTQKKTKKSKKADGTDETKTDTRTDTKTDTKTDKK